MKITLHSCKCVGKVIVAQNMRIYDLKVECSRQGASLLASSLTNNKEKKNGTEKDVGQRERTERTDPKPQDIYAWGDRWW